ncbi:MAG: hypothetical protein ACREC3_15505 [Methyloceanibacter sp.]
MFGKHMKRLAAVVSIPVWPVCRPAFAAEPPIYTDEGVLNHLKQAYKVSQMIDGSTLRWKSAEDMRETGLRQAPQNLNQFTPTPDHFNKSRYCEARIVFEDGTSDSSYFRIDGRKDAEATDFNFDPCFLRYDVTKSGCSDQRIPP